MLTLVLDVLPFPEVHQARRVAVAVFLGHQSVIHLHEMNTKVSSFVVYFFESFQHLRTFFIFVIDCKIMPIKS